MDGSDAPSQQGNRAGLWSALLAWSLFSVLMALAPVAAQAGSVTLAWDPVTTAAVAGYRLHYGPSAGNYTASIDVGNTTSRTVQNLTDGATYHFAATAYDSAGASSGYSNNVAATVPFAAPVANFSASTLSGPAPLSLNFINSSTGSITTYAWNFGDGTTSSVQSPAKTYNTSGTYTVSLTVTGPGGTNTRTNANYITVTAGGDTSAPTVPGGLAATANGTSGINLSWTASSDNVGVTGYRVERCQGASCTTFTQVAAPATTSFSDSGLSANTTYTYRVRAADAAGNLSGFSSSVAATTETTSSAGGFLTGKVSQRTSNANLSTLGTEDWITWPINARKAAGGSKISAYAVVGGTSTYSYTADPRTLSWNDGAPVASGSHNSGVATSGTGAGFSITAPADTTTRTLRIYAGAIGVPGTFRAHLSDGSAADYVSTTAANKWGKYDVTYTLVYRAASAGQTLRVTWVQAAGGVTKFGATRGLVTSSSSGSVTLQGAALTVGP